MGDLQSTLYYKVQKYLYDSKHLWTYSNFKDCIQVPSIMTLFTKKDMPLKLAKHSLWNKFDSKILHLFLSNISDTISFILNIDDQITKVLTIIESYRCVKSVRLNVDLENFDKVVGILPTYSKINNLHLTIYPFHRDNWDLLCQTIAADEIFISMLELITPGWYHKIYGTKIYDDALKEFSEKIQTNWTLNYISLNISAYQNDINRVLVRNRGGENECRKILFLCGSVIEEDK